MATTSKTTASARKGTAKKATSSAKAVTEKQTQAKVATGVKAKPVKAKPAAPKAKAVEAKAKPATLKAQATKAKVAASERTKTETPVASVSTSPPAQPAQPVNLPATAKEVARMQEVLKLQKKAQMDLGPPSLHQRRDWIERAEYLLKDNQGDICEALNADFGNRSSFQSLFSDVASTVDELRYARKNVHKWMKPQSRKSNFPLGLLGAKSRVESIPYGVVGVIAPWNFPVYLTFSPLAGIFAAGNRVMIKPSEHAPASAELMRQLFSSTYDESEVAVFLGDGEVSAAFSSQPFDHLLYTGGGAVAKHIMRAAAEHLTPLTLELGGKSPVIVGKDADIEKVASKVMFGKTLNAGQICLAPDYLMLPRGSADDFVEKSREAVTRMYPDLKHNKDYTSIVNQAHYDRIQALIEDAKSKGARLEVLNPANEDFSQQEHRKIPPTLVINPKDDMKVMQEEIFGPVLPVVEYDNLDDAIDRVNGGDKPLGLYYFGAGAEQRRVLDKTSSGGVTLNDVMFHIAQNDLPFGGVGPSGMGSYHGKSGFDNFSHQRAIFSGPKLVDPGKMFQPPHTEEQKSKLRSLFRI